MIRWTPWNDLSQVERALLSFVEDRPQRKEGTSALAQTRDAERPVTWALAVDAHEDPTRIVLVADLPGVEEKDVDIQVENNVLVIRGERRFAQPPADEKGESYHRYERVQGAFARSFTLPPTVDSERVTAELRAGVLEVTLPKKPEAQPRAIKVKATSAS